jgi:hypothetical protein
LVVFVAAPRHKLVVEKTPLRRRFSLVVPLALATLVTGGAVTAAVSIPADDVGVSHSSPQADAAPQSRAAQVLRAAASAAPRTLAVSRSADRVVLKPKTTRATKKPTATPTPLPTFTAGPVTGHRFLTTDLNLWTGPGEQYTLLEVLPTGTEVDVTGRTLDGYAEVVREDQSRWVNADYLSSADPAEASPARVGGLSTAPCASGSGMESGITPNAVALHRAVCAQFPQVTTYGGWRADGEHSDGRAIDIMVSGSAGQQIADWVRANASALHVFDVIWAQHIWTVQRASEGWRSMSDRGSVTANHYDHVHVQVN